MKRNVWIIPLAALVALGVGIFVLWETVGNPCTSPVMISNLNEPIEAYSPDKSGAKRVKIGMEGNLSAFQYQLEPGKKTRTSYDPNESLMVTILEGNGLLHSAHFSDKQELIWFREAPIQAGQLLTIPANIAYQLESANETPLRYLIFSTKGSQAKDRLFLREEHPSISPCAPEHLPVQKVGDLNSQPESGAKDVDRVVL